MKRLLVGLAVLASGYLYNVSAHSQGPHWHGYVVAEFKGIFSAGLNGGQEALVADAFRLLTGALDGHVPQFRFNLAHNAVIVECFWHHFPEKSDVVTVLAAKLGYMEGVINTSLDFMAFCPPGTTDCTWEQSRQATLAYLAANRAAWEALSE